MQGEAERLNEARAAKKAGKVLQVVRIEHDHVPESAKFADTCKQLSKHQFPQDYWEQRPGCWVRARMRPCKTLFTPTGAKNGPSLHELEKYKVTDIQFCDGSGTETKRDQWLTQQHR
eukprot:5218338-Karenia_brevis.AAC.1